ncbi:MAG: hypothetical protein K2W96_27340 [Gemmataceae bacterium]|nr:hypothetical protein [Gemmataceae bacterium]
MRSLPDALAECRSSIPAEIAHRLQPLFLSAELRERLAFRLLVYARQGVPPLRPLPTFAGECTPPLADAYAPFKECMAHVVEFPTDPANQRRLADALARADSLNVLVLLGMRLTPASVTDERGFPPPRERLVASATGGEGLSPAARALDKHAPRNARHWGKPEGGTEEKNENALGLVERILDEATWWNVFGHFKHGLVYEAREPAGHGARWGHHGDEFIGFLEPFSDEEEP